MEAGASKEYPATELRRPRERRQDVRYTKLLRVGLVQTRSGKELCLVRNISAGGLMARVYAPKAVGTQATVELKSGCSVNGTVVWTQDPDIGIEFDERVDVEAVLNGYLDLNQRPRLPRLEVDRPVTLRIGSRLCRAVARDISQGGIKADLPIECPRGEIVVSLPGLYPIRGAVRWSQGHQAGIAFNELLPLPTLMGWLVRQPGMGRR
jgi:hypothetical protein